MTNNAHDRRPCRGDAWVKVSPRMTLIDCCNCTQHHTRGGRCTGGGYSARLLVAEVRGWEVPR